MEENKAPPNSPAKITDHNREVLKELFEQTESIYAAGELKDSLKRCFAVAEAQKDLEDLEKHEEEEEDLREFIRATNKHNHKVYKWIALTDARTHALIKIIERLRSKIDHLERGIEHPPKKDKKDKVDKEFWEKPGPVVDEDLSDLDKMLRSLGFTPLNF